MIRNLLKTTLRYLAKQRIYTLINLFGLTIGLGTCILIFLYIQDELSYDKHFTDYDRIFRIETIWDDSGETIHWATTQGYVMHAASHKYPEFESSVKINVMFRPPVYEIGEKKFSEKNVFFVDTCFFEVFPFKFIYGQPEGCLNDPGSTILTKSIAEKYFGKEDPIGKCLKYREFSYTITGVIEDVPRNTHFDFDILHSMNDMRDFWPQTDKPGGPSAFYSYVKLKENVDPNALESKMSENAFALNGIGVEGDTSSIPEGLSAKMILKPVKDIHLKSSVEKEISPNRNIKYIYIFTSIAILILIIAGINYMNLATAQSTKRSKEVGVRKVLGADRSRIFYQFIGESLILTFISLILAFLMVELILPEFNDFTDKDLTLGIGNNPSLIFVSLIIVVFIGVFSGAYPAMYLSRFQPIAVLKSGINSSGTNKVNLLLRRILVTFQFIISIALIIGAFTVFRQLNFIQTKNLGFDKSKVLVLKLNGRDNSGNFKEIKNAFLSIPEIKHASPSSNIPGERCGFFPIKFPNLEEKGVEGNDNGDEGWKSIRMITVGYDFIETLGIKMAEGRSFSEKFGTDGTSAFLLNEAAVKEFNLENPVGETMWYQYSMPEPKTGKVIGVMKDFHYASLHNEVEPLMIHIFPPFYKYLSLKIETDNIKETLKKVEKVWSTSVPGLPMDYFFLEPFYNKMYKEEMNLGTLVTFFTILAIAIACLGLFGMVSYITEQRTKEIGIRKVLGASIASILKIFTKEFIVLLTISNVFAWFIAWYFLNKWLENFSYRIEIELWVFFITAIIAAIIAMLTVVLTSLKAATESPLKAIRYE